MKDELRLFLAALLFLTRVPVPGRVGAPPPALEESARYFPLVGLLVGAWASGVLWLAAHVFSALVALLLALAATAWITGALHEDGLADTCDGLGGGAGRERALAIMKAPHLGSYGVLGLVLVLALKVAALHALAMRDFVATLAMLPLAHAGSRAVCVALMRWLPYAREAAQSRVPLRRARAAVAALALVWALLAGVAATAFVPLPAVLAAAGAMLAVALLVALGLQRRLGGFTGDTLGAAQQLSELAAYLAALALLSHG